MKTVPVVMHCAACDGDVELDGVQSFRCPRCNAPCSDLRQGRELEIEAIEIEEADQIEESTAVSKQNGVRR